MNPLEDDFEDQLREETENFSISPKRTNCDFLGTDKQGRHIFGIYASRFPEKSQMEIFIRYIHTCYVYNAYCILKFEFNFHF